MKKIQELVDYIDDELCGAKEYAEKYIGCKAAGNSVWANKFKEMANDELKHAMYLHDKAMVDIEELSKVFTAPKKMQDEWEKCHKKYVEKEAWIKQMLAM